ncbi:hypothetical protein RFI_17189, partial [Reticulomyxa filosa]
LTFQEWFSAYYLVHCLYQPIKSNDHKQVLINEQLNPKYSMIIPFMAGILYDFIENKKDPDGSGLLSFWKLLHFSSFCQLSPVHQMILNMRCLDVCKADAESKFLSSQLRNCHKNLINSFKSFLIAWINFDENIGDKGCKIMCDSFDRVIKPHLSNLQDILARPDIWLCFINKKKLDKLNQTVIRRHRMIFMDILEAIASKMSEMQMDDALEFLLDKLHDENEYIHGKCVQLIEKISWKMNEKQLGDTF